MTNTQANPPPASSSAKPLRKDKSPSVPTSGESGLRQDRPHTPPVEGIFCCPVAEEDVEIEFQRLMRALPDNLAPEEKEELSTKLKQQARDLAVNRQLLLEEARRRAIEAPESEIDAILARAGSQDQETREKVRNACLVEKLIRSVIAAVPKPTRAEIITHLREATSIVRNGGHNPELFQKLIDKTGALRQRLRQNRSVNEFIAELRKKTNTQEE